MTPFLTCFYPAERNRPQALQVGKDWPGSSVRVGCSSLNIIIMFSNIFLWWNFSRDWRDSTEPVMTAYKLVTVQFKW